MGSKAGGPVEWGETILIHIKDPCLAKTRQAFEAKLSAPNSGEVGYAGIGA